MRILDCLVVEYDEYYEHQFGVMRALFFSGFGTASLGVRLKVTVEAPYKLFSFFSIVSIV